MNQLLPPYQFFGGKRRVAHVIWKAFGNLDCYIEPFFGSGAVLLARPQPVRGVEVVNDLNGFIINFWRAVVHAPESVVRHSARPMSQDELMAMKVYIKKSFRSLSARLQADINFYDPIVAGLWVAGQNLTMSCDMGICTGPWHVVDNEIVRAPELGKDGNRDDGMRVRNTTPYGKAAAFIANPNSQKGKLMFQKLLIYYQQLAERLCSVIIHNREWNRVLFKHFLYGDHNTGVFLDPPYSDKSRTIIMKRSYVSYSDVSAQVNQWCVENSNLRNLRIAVCGLDGEHNNLEDLGWTKYCWSAQGSFYKPVAERRVTNYKDERIWFSPSCQLQQAQPDLFSLNGTHKFCIDEDVEEVP